MEEIVKTITTNKGGKVSLIKPDKGLPFFRYLAGAVATTDSFRYVIRQHGQEDIATVKIEVTQPQDEQPDDQKKFNNELQAFLKCMDAFMDGSPGTMALTNLLGIDEGDVLNDDWLNKIFIGFKYVDYAREGEPLIFEEHLGIYTYLPEDNYWQFEPGGKVVTLKFPSSPDVKKNDTEWVIDHLKTIPTKTEDGLYHLPVSLETRLSINEKLLLELRINEVKYLEETAIPLHLDVQAIAAPYAMHLRLESKNGQEFAIQGGISSPDGCHLDIDTAWFVNQDLREKIDEEQVVLVKGELNINNITFNNLGSFWEAAKADISDQDELDKLMNVECLLEGKKIGDIRFLIKEEIVQLVYLDGSRQNISDIVVEHFKQYFNEPKPNGELRNTAFDLSASTAFRKMPTATTSLGQVKTKTTKNLTQAVRQRTIRSGANLSDLAADIAVFFKEEERISSPGDDFIRSPYPAGDFTPVAPLITPDDKPDLGLKPVEVKEPIAKAPGKTGPAVTITSDATKTVKPVATKVTTPKPKAPTKKPDAKEVKPAEPKAVAKPKTVAQPKAAAKPKATTTKKTPAKTTTTAKKSTVKKVAEPAKPTAKTRTSKTTKPK
jgi:hypothetical protein